MLAGNKSENEVFGSDPSYVSGESNGAMLGMVGTMWVYYWGTGGDKEMSRDGGRQGKREY